MSEAVAGDSRVSGPICPAREPPARPNKGALIHISLKIKHMRIFLEGGPQECVQTGGSQPRPQNVIFNVIYKRAEMNLIPLFGLAKRLVAAAKFFVEATKNSFVVPNFFAVTKPCFSCSKTWPSTRINDLLSIEDLRLMQGN